MTSLVIRSIVVKKMLNAGLRLLSGCGHGLKEPTFTVGRRLGTEVCGVSHFYIQQTTNALTLFQDISGSVTLEKVIREFI